MLENSGFELPTIEHLTNTAMNFNNNVSVEAEVDKTQETRIHDTTKNILSGENSRELIQSKSVDILQN